MTHSLVLELELLSPTVLTADASTLGGHQTLQHIPGGLLKGALASRCYAQVLEQHGEQGAFDWFHSSALRIGDALPVHSSTQHTGFPVPLALVAEKNATPWTAGVLSNEVGARTQQGFSMTGQLRQVRAGFLTNALHRVQPTTREHMRTAMRADGRARDGHLFSESYLEPGQRFRALVQADSADLLSGLKEALDGRELPPVQQHDVVLLVLLVLCQALPAVPHHQLQDLVLVALVDEDVLLEGHPGQLGAVLDLREPQVGQELQGQHRQ